MSSTPLLPRGLASATYAAAALFGSFWGVWGASVPRIREQTGIGDGQLGVALLFIAAGALPAMLLTGRALDRWGLRFAAATVIALGLTGVGVAATAHGFVTLCLGLTVVGAASGAADVARNTTGGRAERLSGRPIIVRSAGVFSSLVVLSSLGSGALFAVAPTFVPFLIVAALSIFAGGVIVRALPPGSTHVEGSLHEATDATASRLRYTPLLWVGVLGALAFASENAHQSWGAVFLEDELAASPGVSAVAPAVFAAAGALTRFAIGASRPGRSHTVLLAGALAAAAGTVVVARAPSFPVALAGLIVAAAGTAVLFPTLLSIVSRNVNELYRGRATAFVTIVSYLGYLLGPVYVGLWSQGTGLRGAMLAVAALSGVLLFLTLPLLRLSGFTRQTEAEAKRAPVSN